MNKVVWVFLLGMIMIGTTGFSEVAIPYGEGDGKVSFWNAKLDKTAEELNPAGPMSFRFGDGHFWVADSLAGRILKISPDGKQLQALEVFKPGSCRIEDISLVQDVNGKLEYILALCQEPEGLVKVSLDGKEVSKMAGSFSQAQLIETSAIGNFAVADVADQSLTIFGKSGTKLRKLHWEWSGLCFDHSGNICYLQWDDKAKVNHLTVETVDGKPVRKVALKIGDHTNPRLWSVDKDGNAIVSFIPPSGFTGSYGIKECDADGKPVKSGFVKPPVVMNRFLEKNPAGGWFLGEANFDVAPEGDFKIVDYSY